MLQIIRKVANKILDVQANALHQVELLRYAKNLPTLNPQEEAIVTACRQEGVCLTSLEALNIPATDAMLKVAAQQLAVMEARVTGSVQGTVERPVLPQIFAVGDLPEFAAWAYHPSILRMVENYVGLPVKFQGAHLRRDFSNETPVTTEFWHRDDEDRRIIKVFIYLTDVEAEHGPFEYIPRQRVKGWKMRQILSSIGASHKRGQLGIDDAEMATLVPREDWRDCPCRAGSVLFADTRAIFHHGKSRRLSRSAIFLVYTAANPRHPEFCTQYNDRTFARPDAVGVA